jgi:ribosomal protein S18 acetylase RimI-like enzyme
MSKVGERLRIVDVDREEIEDFLGREWPPVNERLFGRSDPAMWEVLRYVLAAYDDATMVGAAVLKVEGGLGKVTQIITAADRRGQGIGRALMSRVEEICRQEGCHKVSLKTYWNSQAQRFYSSQGYVIEGILRHDLHGLDMCQMCKFL